MMVGWVNGSCDTVRKCCPRPKSCGPLTKQASKGLGVPALSQRAEAFGKSRHHRQDI